MLSPSYLKARARIDEIVSNVVRDAEKQLTRAQDGARTSLERLNEGTQKYLASGIIDMRDRPGWVDAKIHQTNFGRWKFDWRQYLLGLAREYGWVPVIIDTAWNGSYQYFHLVLPRTMHSAKIVAPLFLAPSEHVTTLHSSAQFRFIFRNGDADGMKILATWLERAKSPEVQQLIRNPPPKRVRRSR